MRTTNLSEEQNQMMNLDIIEMAEDKHQNQHHKPLWAMMIHKTVPIGYEYHQVQVSDFHPPSSPISPKQLPPPLSPPVYLRSSVQLEELEEFLAFVENFFQEKIPDYFSQGINSRDRARTKAMQFLHEMRYNYIRAKFYMLFPYYLSFNHFKCHQPLMLSDQEMTRRISEHLQGLKSTKEKDLQRWIGTVQNSIQSRIHINKLNTLIEVAKQNKFQIPEAIRQQVQRSVRTGREIKKALHSTRLTLDKLILKRESLQQCKIITNQMIQFQETVGRCEQWLKKQQKFQENFFTPENGDSRLRPLSSKIEFRTLQILVNEFNNLPLIYDNFQKTTGALYTNTITLLERLPPLNKAAKTRTAQNLQVSSKVSIETVQQFLGQIQACPVQHEQFTAFQCTIRQNIEWLERIGLWLEDQKSQKSLKILNQYAKIINDIPISNRIQLKLQSRLQYYEIMERVKKDISNPAKYEQIKDAIKKLKEKGYQTCQYSKLETRIISYMGWYESQQILNQDRVPPTVLDLTTKLDSIKQRMISQQAFKSQLLSARHELNIPEEVWIESQGKVRAVEQLRLKIQILQQQEEPLLNDIVQTIKASIKNGLLFPEFEMIYSRMVQIFNILAQIEYLLINSSERLLETDQFYFKEEEVHLILANLIDLNGLQIKDLQTKQTGDYLLKQSRSHGFPKKIPEYRIFELFMEGAEAWSQKAIHMIAKFKGQNGGQSHIRELIEQSKNYLHTKSIQQQLARIDIVLKWRQKIGRKLSENKQNPFNQNDEIFLKQLEKYLQQAQSSMENGQTTKIRALQYLSKWARRITQILEKISTVEIQCTYKLSQMNKFCKEIDRQIQKYRLDDKVIFDLKEQLQRQLQLSDQWKQKYLAIKRFERKKQKKQEQEIKEIPQVDISINLRDDEIKNNGVVIIETPAPIPYIPTLIGGNMLEQNKKKYFIRNGQFCWYFKLLLMIFQFYNGYHLKFVIQELIRLRGTLSDIFRFISHYNITICKQDKTDQDLLLLEAEGSKFPIFFRQIYVLAKKNAYISSWKEIADSVIKSVPVLSMELKARKPQQLLQLLQMKKNQKEEGKGQQGRGQELGTKRKRKQNPFYSNEDMTLITEQTFGLKGKKKRKGLNPDSEYRNTAVASTAKKLARNHRQQVERAQAILSSEVPAEFIHIDDPKEYCICRYGVPNENSVMIQCQYRCQEWFHIQCLGIKKHQAKSDIKLKCVGCRALYKEDSVGYFFWDSHAKITQYALRQLIEEGRELGVETPQMKKLQLLSTKVQNWKTSVKDILKKVCQTNGEDLPTLESSLYELYLQSLWLPSAHLQSTIIRKLVLMARNEL